jgi:hypothetical protein
VATDDASCATRLRAAVDAAAPRLLALPEDATRRRPGPGKWSPVEVIGHLIDSASNNHQRFVRAQFQAHMSFPRYVQDEWIGAQGYGERPWKELVELWRLYNRHLVHVMGRVPAAVRGNVCVVAADEPSTLEDHMIDYVGHLQHHLDQILA